MLDIRGLGKTFQLRGGEAHAEALPAGGEAGSGMRLADAAWAEAAGGRAPGQREFTSCSTPAANIATPITAIMMAET